MTKHRIAVDVAVLGEVRVAAIEKVMLSRYHRNRFEIVRASLGAPALMNAGPEAASTEAIERSQRAVILHKAHYGIGFSTFAWSHKGISQNVTTMLISDQIAPLAGVVTLMFQSLEELTLLNSECGKCIEKHRVAIEKKPAADRKTVRMVDLLLSSIVNMDTFETQRPM